MTSAPSASSPPRRPCIIQGRKPTCSPVDHIAHFSLDVFVVKDPLVAAIRFVIAAIAGRISLPLAFGTVFDAATSRLLAPPLHVVKTTKNALVELLFSRGADLFLLETTSVLEIC